MGMDITTTSTGVITDITQANPARLTSAGHGLVDGDWVYIHSVNGMVNINSKTYYVRNKNTDEFDLHDFPTNAPIDSTGFSTYGSLGTWLKANGTGKAVSNVVDLIDVDKFTMGFWFYATGAVGNPGVGFTTAVKLASGNTAYRITLAGTSDSDNPTVQFVSNYPGASGRWGATAAVTLNTWHLIAVAYDCSDVANKPTFYIDGVAVARTDVRQPIGTRPGLSGGGDQIQGVSFGRGQGGLQQLYNCILGEAFFFDTDNLGADQHAAMFRLQPTMHHDQVEATAAISAVSNDDPARIESNGHGFDVGSYQRLLITGVGGVTSLNGNTYYGKVFDANNFDLFTIDDASVGVDTTGDGAYTSGGTWEHRVGLRAYWPMRGTSLSTEIEFKQAATLTLENATATVLHPPVPPASSRLGNRSVIQVLTSLPGELVDFQPDTMIIADGLVDLKTYVPPLDKWFRETDRPQDPVYEVTSY